MGEYAEYGFDQQGWYGMFVACGIWCLADVSSVSPSSEQTIHMFCTNYESAKPTVPSFRLSPHFLFPLAARPPSSSGSPISRPRVKTRSKTPLLGFLAKEETACRLALRWHASLDRVVAQIITRMKAMRRKQRETFVNLNPQWFFLLLFTLNFTC